MKKQKELVDTKSKEPAAMGAATVLKRQPLRTIRVEDCSASIWAREAQVRGDIVVFYSVTFERSYKDRDGSWKYTKSFDFESLGKLVRLCQEASEVIESLQP